MRTDALQFLLDLQKCAKKTWKWWDDSVFMLLPLYDAKPVIGTVNVCIKFPEDSWPKAWEIAQFMERCKKAWGKDAPILDAIIVCDSHRNVFLTWKEKRCVWTGCEKLLKNWQQFRKPEARIIHMSAC